MIVSPVEPPPRNLEELLGPELAARLDRMDVLSRRMFAGKLPGERRSKRRGQSVEFDDYRDYLPGDDLRHIDWNVLARLDRLFIKLFREDEDLGVHLVIDASPSMRAGATSTPDGAGLPSKLLYAHRLATALGYIALVNQNRLSVAAFTARGVRRLPESRGRRNVQRLSAFLIDSLAQPEIQPGDQAQQAGPDLPFDQAMRRVALALRGRGVVVLLSDMLHRTGIEHGLGYLAFGGGRSAGFDLHCVQILSPGELDPSREAGRGLTGDLRLADIEGGPAAEITVSPRLIEAYKRRLDAHHALLDRACRARGVRRHLVSTETPVRDVVLNALRRGGLLG